MSFRAIRCPKARPMRPFCANCATKARAAATGRITSAPRQQIERELALIEKLGLAGYFLIVWDIVRFCREQAFWCRAAARRPTARSVMRSESRRSIRSAWTCCSSASSPKSAASGRISISICPAATSASAPSSMSTSATASSARP